MQYLVIKDFIDKNTLLEFKAGYKYACPDSERADSLILMGYLAANETAEDDSEQNAAESQQEESEEAEPEEKPQKAAKSASKKSVKNKKA